MIKLAFALLVSITAAGAAAQAPPNILLIIADDMGIDMSRCHALGKGGPALPHLEALCATGLVFDNAYSAPVCSPTRATIMTGRYGFRTGIGAALPPRGGSGLAADGKSLFDVLGRTSYSAAVIGKWHLAGGDQGMDHPRQLGVKDYFGIFSGAARDYFDWDAIDNGKPVKVSGYATTVLTDRAVNWVAAQRQPGFSGWPTTRRMRLFIYRPRGCTLRAICPPTLPPSAPTHAPTTKRPCRRWTARSAACWPRCRPRYGATPG